MPVTMMSHVPQWTLSSQRSQLEPIFTLVVHFIDIAPVTLLPATSGSMVDLRQLQAMARTHLPPEVLHLVIVDFIPPPMDHLLGDTLFTRHHKIYIDSLQYLAYYQHLAQLRLVCSHWYQVITPILYSTFLFFIEPRARVERQLVAFRAHPELIRHLILYGRGRSWPVGDKQARRQEAELLQACISECTNLRTLQLSNAEHFLSTLAPSDALKMFQSNRRTFSNLTSVIILSNNVGYAPQRSVSKTLIGLGPNVCSNLTNLEISNGYGLWDLPNELPSSFPSLTRLCLRWCGELPATFRKLLARVIRKVHTDRGSEQEGGIRYIVPLRELVLWTWQSSAVVKVDWMKDLLAINNLNLALQILDLRIRSAVNVDYGEYEDTPLAILQMCPSVVGFRYFAPFSSFMLDELPIRLQEVGIQVSIITTPASTLRRYGPTIGGFPRFGITNLKPVIEWVQSWDDGYCGMKRIGMCFVERNNVTDTVHNGELDGELLEDWKTLGQVCFSKGILLRRYY